MFDLATWVHHYGSTVGYAIISAIIFSETGLFFGFFLPGDSVLFPAGIIASQGYFNLIILCSLVFISAVLGNIVGYFFGKYLGQKLYSRKDSKFFKREHLDNAHDFYNRHGGKTIILARFLPVIRTFGPIVAGMSEMHFGKFVTYSMIGAVLWAIGVPVAGYYLGKSVPDVDKYLLPIIIGIILLSIFPALYETLRTEERRAKFAKALRLKK